MPSKVAHSLTREQVRRVDKLAIASGVPGIELMERAGLGAVEVLLECGWPGPYFVVCGKGNNGGDGFVMARRLWELQLPVEVVLACDPSELAGDAKLAFDRMQFFSIPVRCWSGVAAGDWARAGSIIDAILGTGAVGAARPPASHVIAAMSTCRVPILAIDIPSGLDCDAGEAVGPAVRATGTATFVARKRGFDNPTSTQYTGWVRVVDIGIDETTILQAIADRQSENGTH